MQSIAAAAHLNWRLYMGRIGDAKRCLKTCNVRRHLVAALLRVRLDNGRDHRGRRVRSCTRAFLNVGLPIRGELSEPVVPRLGYLMALLCRFGWHLLVCNLRAKTSEMIGMIIRRLVKEGHGAVFNILRRSMAFALDQVDAFRADVALKVPESPPQV
jgi:hypothetical protein